MLKKLPIGIQTFSEIINENMLYIDKTESIYNLLNNYKYVFLSRPRRFGKSLLMDTIHELYEGNENLFKGLYIEDKWDWDTQYPVIKISFNGGVYNKEELEKDLTEQLSLIYKNFGIKHNKNEAVKFQFSDLIIKAKEKFGNNVVILIDEYDKPLLDNLHKIEQAKIVRDGLKDFYTQIKDNDRNIKYAMLTGVSKFAKVSLFSGANNFKDISLQKRYSDICGYTQNDLETVFKDYLKDVDMLLLKKWYDGFKFNGDDLYNPYDIMLFIKNNKVFNNYWFETGTPAYLIELIKQNQYYLPELNDYKIRDTIANSFDIENISLETIMLQAGYLTITKQQRKGNNNNYILNFPNMEVEISFYEYILGLFACSAEKVDIADDLYDIFENGNIEDLEPVIKRLFAGIAYNNFTKNEIATYEGFYASVIYAYLASLGLELKPEDVTNKGRIDLTLICGNRTFIFEFKVIDEDPLKQIKEKKYYEQYAGEIYIVGIVFDKTERNVTKFEWEQIS